MAEIPKLNHPWLVAVWPGMGHVALNAGFYLLAQLDMHVGAELEDNNLFDIDHVEVKGGVIRPARRPRNRFFIWQDPKKERDLVVFVGETQPPLGKYPFCKQMMAYAKELGVERVFTFAAMATQMHPTHRCRVFGAATVKEGLDEIHRRKLELLEDGNIGGLNGVLLGAAAEADLPGLCLLGEMPHIFHQLPFPKASLAILEVFSTIAGIDIDFSELSEQARSSEEQLGQILAQVEEAYGRQLPSAPESESFEPPQPEEDKLTSEDRQRIETLFKQAVQQRSKAFELKRELDRLGVFSEFEDRFLDLFKKPE
ncbi:MAG: PAC2 family protein [Gemmataceae bacterium]